MTYMLLKIVLMTTAIGMSTGRHRMLALSYFYLWALTTWLVTPSVGQSWYWLMGGVEAITILVAMILNPRVANFVIGMSLLNLTADAASVALNASGIHAFYPLYPYIIRFGELCQCGALILYSNGCLVCLKKLHRFLLEHRGTQWMLRLLKPLVT